MRSALREVRWSVALVGTIATGCAGGGTPQETLSTFGNNSSTPTSTSGGGSDEVGSGIVVGSTGGSAEGGQDSTAADPDCVDEDGDDFGENCQAGEDCNDEDPGVNPGAPEACDGVDQNCDMIADNGCECPVDNVSSNCNLPTDLGALQPGESKVGVVGNVPQEGAIDWYKVAFPNVGRPGMGTPAISFAINEGEAFVFDVVTGQCAAAGATCSSGGSSGQAIALTDWSFVDNDPLCCAPPNDSMVPWPNEVYLRVYRTSGGASCTAYQLQVAR